MFKLMIAISIALIRNTCYSLTFSFRSEIQKQVSGLIVADSIY